MTHHSTAARPHIPTELDAVRAAANAVSAAHLFAYLIPEAAEEAAALGVTERTPRYFALRAAALGTVPWQVALATFYNFSPRAVRTLAGVWDVAPPARWQAARFAAVGRAMRRVGVPLAPDAIAAARSLLDPVVAAADYAGKPMAAANAAVPLPDDPLVALWQQITVLREWRGDAHIAVLVANRLGPCDCNVLHAATGRLPAAVLRATRLWNDNEWAAATARLAARGWLDADGTATAEGLAAREQLETDTDEHCAELWSPIGDPDTRRLVALLTPISDAFTAAGTFAGLH
ncbi:SCO6745 family protein [Nocardia sp. alder85J]|uniref:SCO6745 family protein n=1 Tax=Nocardia sp. alder85J TaxID=2862949 RepID=UPI001CD24CED|nr:hypothetical protein [Nocardia sp. alder85J]MCX4094337.1 hypothetical protein [Nocardia sp. alder85J]